MIDGITTITDTTGYTDTNIDVINKNCTNFSKRFLSIMVRNIVDIYMWKRNFVVHFVEYS